MVEEPSNSQGGRLVVCNLYSITKNQEAVRNLFKVTRDNAGNLPSLPAIFPDGVAPVVRQSDERELQMMRWGMPGPPQFGDRPITNIRNTKSAHWRRWLKPDSRCLVLFSSFCEYEGAKTPKTPTWFALDESRPLIAFAGLCAEWNGTRGTKANPVEGSHLLFGFLTTETEQRRGADPSEGDASHSHEPVGVGDVADRTMGRGVQAATTFAR